MLRIESIELIRIRIPFKVSFRHALKDRRHSDALLLVARSDAGLTGLGEILPREYLTGETIEQLLDSAHDGLAAEWVGRSFDAPDELRAALGRGLDAAGRRLACFAGLEIALFDLAGRQWGFPIGEVLRRPVRALPPAGHVIGFEVPTPKLRKHCALLRLTGTRHVKIKVGGAEDLERLSIAAEALGSGTGLRIDANAAWSAAEAVERLRAMAHLPLRSVEQPVAAGDLEGMRRVREETGLPVMADEALCSLADAERLLAAEAVDIFNVRLGKCGGMLGSLRLVELAERTGLACHLGTLVGETGILSAAGEAFAARVEGFEYLEGRGQTARLLDGDIVTPEGAANGAPPGLGLRLAEEPVRRYNIGQRIMLRAGGRQS